jgi:hypothetical protein
VNPTWDDPNAALDHLASSLEREAALADELASALERLRGALARNDLAALDADVAAAGRVLVTLGEARRARRERLSALAHDADATLEQLASRLGRPIPVRLAAARRTLAASASRATREAAINREVLRGAMNAGAAYVQALFGESFTASYSAGPKHEASRGGVVIDRVG